MIDWQTIDDDKEKYKAYLCSRDWSEKKEAVKRRSLGLCERCQHNPGDHVHHLTYIRKYNEHLDDLQHLCRACHEFTHGKSDHDPALPQCYRVPLSPLFAAYHRDGSALEILCPVCRKAEQFGYESGVHYNTPEKIHPASHCYRLPMYCEGGHQWYLNIEMDKGNTFMTITDARDFDYGLPKPQPDPIATADPDFATLDDIRELQGWQPAHA